MSGPGGDIRRDGQPRPPSRVDLENRVAIITGASQGLGLTIARAFMQAGADLVLCARDKRRLEDAGRELRESSPAERRIVLHAADISKESDARRLVEMALSAFPRIHILVNNAGVYGPMGSLEETDWREWVAAVEINLFGSTLMCRTILPHFKAAGYGKIIQLSGGGATNPLPFLSAYAASKAAVVRFAETLACEVAGTGIDVNSIAPGALNTRFLDQVLQAGPEKVGKSFYEKALNQKSEGGVPLEKGARLAVFLASAASDGITGRLLSAVWDPWESLGDHVAELSPSDVYTLRRIVPSDRGMRWG